MAEPHCILGVDPGSEHSGVVLFNPADKQRPIMMHQHAMENAFLVDCLLRGQYPGQGHPGPLYGLTCVIEDIQSHTGCPVGKSVFDTLKWVGQFQLAWRLYEGEPAELILPATWRNHLCEIPNPKPAWVKASLSSRFGGDKKAALGTKKAPGPLFGIKDHAWDALGAGLSWWEMRNEAGRAEC